MSALTQWIALNVANPEQLEGVNETGELGHHSIASLLDIWEPGWRNFTQQALGAIPAEQLPAANPDLPCPHTDFEAGVSVQRIVGDNGYTAVGYYAELQVACRVCDERWRWTGVKPGLSPTEPRMSVDGLTLLAPFRPASADDDFGMGLPGFDVNVIGPDLGHDRTAAAVRKRAMEDAAELVRGQISPTMSIAARRSLRHAVTALHREADRHD